MINYLNNYLPPTGILWQSKSTWAQKFAKPRKSGYGSIVVVQARAGSLWPYKYFVASNEGGNNNLGESGMTVTSTIVVIVYNQSLKT